VVNVEAQLLDPDSILNMYRRLLDLRRDSSALRIGSFLAHPASTEEVFAYRRESDDETMTIVLNLSDSPQTLSMRRGQVAFSTVDPHRADRVKSGLLVEPLEGVIVSHA
jgi:alpha-glucosidase